MGLEILDSLIQDEEALKSSPKVTVVVEAYRTAFSSCALVLDLDRCAFQAEWFSEFYKRNYDALMVKNLYDNIIDDVDEVRDWYVPAFPGNETKRL